MRDYFNEERVVGAFIVHGYSIISTDEVTFAVYEPAARMPVGYTHSTITHSDEHGLLGAVRTRALPAEIAGLPYGDERIRQCDLYHRGLDALADELILAAFPEVPFTTRAHGTAWARLDEVNAAVAS